MKCPIDNEDLIMTDRNGVEIDYCPRCRGIWLDRGELDKIIERSPKTAAQTYQDDQSQHGNNRHPDKPKKRESILSELFDF